MHRHQVYAESPSNSTIVVDVRGDLHHLGMNVLPGDTHVKDALRAVGGCNNSKDVKYFNVAAVLDDGGEMVLPNAVEEQLL